MTIARVMEVTGNPITTLMHTCGDTAQTLDDVTNFVFQELSNSKLRNVVAVLITCETNDIRFSWGTNPTQVGVGHVLAAGQSLKLTSHKQVKDFRFINKTNGSNAILQITPETSEV